jgi:hypothetical protein
MKPYKLFLLFFAMLNAGCGESLYTDALQSAPLVPRFTFSLSFPPKVLLRPDTNTILLINRVDLSKLQVPALDLGVIKAGAYTALKYAGDQLAVLHHVRVINLTDSVDFELNKDSVAVLSAKYHADYTLALLQYSAGVSRDGVHHNDITGRTRTYYNNKVYLNFTMYLGKGYLYKELPGSDTTRSIQHQYGDDPYDFAPPTIGVSKDFIVNATQNATFIALRDYLPYTETESRPIYSDKKFGPLADELIFGQLDKISSSLQPFLNDRDPVLAAKAAYNIAVVYESHGDLDKAMSMAQLSLDKSKNNYARNLISYLKSK